MYVVMRWQGRLKARARTREPVGVSCERRTISCGPLTRKLYKME